MLFSSVGFSWRVIQSWWSITTADAASVAAAAIPPAVSQSVTIVSNCGCDAEGSYGGWRCGNREDSGGTGCASGMFWSGGYGRGGVSGKFQSGGRHCSLGIQITSEVSSNTCESLSISIH